jgi:hypothetical protein
MSRRPILHLFLDVLVVSSWGGGCSPSTGTPVPKDENLEAGASLEHSDAAGSGVDAGGDASHACVSTNMFSCTAISGSAVLSSLSAQQAALCDCLAAYGGGYGAPVTCTCSDGSPGALGAPSSQAACVSMPFPATCPITLDQYATCINLTWSNPCDPSAILVAAQSPSCAPLGSAECQ